MNLALKWRIQVQSAQKREFELVTTRPAKADFESLKSEFTDAISQLDAQIESLRHMSTTEETIRLLKQAEVKRSHYQEFLSEDLKEVEEHEIKTIVERLRADKVECAVIGFFNSYVSGNPALCT